MTYREYAKVEREALIAEMLNMGPMTVTGLVRTVYCITTTEKIPRSVIARFTQSLRVMEREGIVERRQGKRVLDWRLARLYQAKRPPAVRQADCGRSLFCDENGTLRPEPVIVLVERLTAGAPWQVDLLVTA